MFIEALQAWLYFFFLKMEIFMKKFFIKKFALLAMVGFAMTALYSSHSDSESDDLVGEILDKPSPKRTIVCHEGAGTIKDDCADVNAWKMLVKGNRATFTSHSGLGVSVDTCGEIKIDGVGCISYAVKGDVVRAVELGRIVLELNRIFTSNIEHLMSKYVQCECKDEHHSEGCHKHKK